MTFITQDDANQVALSYLTKLEQEFGEPLGLANSETLDKSFGWVFFYNSKAYLETGDFGSMLGGNAPFIVNKSNGEVVITGTAKPVEDYIADYEQELDNR
jgi:hypothetical protein